MGRYTKYHSNYLLRKRHQSINGGAIYEKDWVTLGERLRFGPGKKPLYTDGNFVFTGSSVAPFPKRRKNATLTEVYQYNDVEYSTDVVNAVVPSVDTNDIRTFAYYGSCVELVRASVETIVAEFPGCITQGTEQLKYYDTTKNEFEIVGTGYIINNPFNIDLHHKNVQLGEYDNPYRFLSATWEDYTVNGDAITAYTIEPLCEEEQIRCCWYEYYDGKPFVTVTIATKSEDGKESSYLLEGYLDSDGITWLYNGDELLIRPNNDIIEDYFNGLKGFERQLLNRKTNPLYKNTFITPVMAELNYHYVERSYIWPLMSGTDYCVDIDSIAYENFINSLTNLATLMDEIWTDNLYSHMTHEAIKNFDWTYTREYVEGDEQDNIDGGERMKKILHIAARLMDDSKRYIDTVGLLNKATYSGYGNMPSAVLSDKLGYSGWDIVSTVPNFTDDDGNPIDMGNITLEGVEDWYYSMNPAEITPLTTDIEFCRRLLLSSAHIFRTKGTRESIEMVMGMFGFGGNDFFLTERYYTVVPQKATEEKEINQTAYDDNGKKTKDDTTTGTWHDFITDVNDHKGISKVSEDDFAGLPLTEYSERTKNAESELGYDETTWIIPYFDQSKYDDNEPYDGDIYFQQAGGWGKTFAPSEDEWTLDKALDYEEWRTNGGNETPYYQDELLSHINYKETISYLHIVSTIADLLDVNSRSVVEGDIYYVVNINDFEDYYESIADDTSQLNPDAVTHFFMFRYGAYDASVYSSWMNVSLTEGENEYDGNIAEKVEYLDSLVNTVFGNNPHSGYGKYDQGVSYLEYLHKPFKYAIDNNTISGTNEDGILYSTIADAITFDISEPILVEYKIDEKNALDKVINRTQESREEVAEGASYINSKVLVFENNLVDPAGLYKVYFMNVILPYVMQVIPSTTILILKRFEQCYDFDDLKITELNYADASWRGGTVSPNLAYEQPYNYCDEAVPTTARPLADDPKKVITYGAKTEYSITGNPNDVSINPTSGIITCDANTGSGTRNLGTVTVVVTLNGKTASTDAPVWQEAISYEYSVPIVTLSYPPISADGGKSTPTYSYTQTNFDTEEVYTDGGTLNFSIASGTTSSLESLDGSTGLAIYNLENKASSPVRLATVQLDVTMNGVTGNAQASVYQEAGVGEAGYALRILEYSYYGISINTLDGNAWTISPTLSVVLYEIDGNGYVLSKQDLTLGEYSASFTSSSSVITVDGASGTLTALELGDGEQNRTATLTLSASYHKNGEILFGTASVVVTQISGVCEYGTPAVTIDIKTEG
ncbi:MAG: hypothetical protein LUD72_09560 [Bacteroidales bacterium]|nr:hypothetical protein [Bacteroidales bacterium]